MKLMIKRRETICAFRNMAKFYEGKIKINASALDLDQTLLGGQSFR